jgi:hypothetical protein
MRWSRLALVALLFFDVRYRAHTFAPHFRDAAGISVWPAAVGPSEPLDCDEAAYAYIGHRICLGDVMYRDLTENKPPLGYWIYALAVAIGGYQELAIRVLPIPFVLVSIILIWWIAWRLGGPMAASMAAAIFVVFSTDPFLFGNGANLEHFINAFAIAALALIIRGWDDRVRWPFAAAGICLGAAILVKQVAIVSIVVFALAITLRVWRQDSTPRRKALDLCRDLAALGIGVFAILFIATVMLILQGAGTAAYEDIFRYGPALATDTLPEPAAPPRLVRLITGNADPQGRLPWPFGATDYLVWWGAGSWPLWLASIPATAYFLMGKQVTAMRRMLGAWTLGSWAQVALPGLYWQHYYLLPTAGAAITVAVCWADGISGLARAIRRDHEHAKLSALKKRSSGGVAMTLTACATLMFTCAIGGTFLIQARDYLLVPPQELTIRYKGGRQWVVLRELGRSIATRTATWSHPQLYVWGWQSPLHFYARLDSPTRHFFVDNLLRDQADRGHSLIEPRTREITAALERTRPALIFGGYPPFRALRSILNQRYLPSRLAPGLWIERSHYGDFEAANGPANPR